MISSSKCHSKFKIFLENMNFFMIYNNNGFDCWSGQNKYLLQNMYLNVFHFKHYVFRRMLTLIKVDKFYYIKDLYLHRNPGLIDNKEKDNLLPLTIQFLWSGYITINKTYFTQKWCIIYWKINFKNPF